MQITGGFIEFLGEHLKVPRSSYSTYLMHSLIYKNESVNVLDIDDIKTRLSHSMLLSAHRSRVSNMK